MIRSIVILLGVTGLLAPGAHAQPDQRIATLQQKAHPVEAPSDLSPLINRATGARLALLGEASHGTQEFYEWRAHISKELIENHGFNFIAVEGDWASMHRLNKYVKDLPGSADSARRILADLDRWPPWMWGNETVEELIEWLREYNTSQPMEQRVGFYGIDVYGPWDSIDAVMTFLGDLNSDLQGQAREAFACLGAHEDDPGAFVRSVSAGASSCLAQVEHLIGALNEKSDDETVDDRSLFVATQHAHVVRNAKRHFLGGQESWNRRVDHFKLTVSRLLEHYGSDSRGVVWAHNTHVGDARATAMARAGQNNIGQLAREAYGPENILIVGFGTHRGTVNAGREWGSPMEIMEVPEAAEGSLEDLLHQVGHESFLLLFDEDEVVSALEEVIGHRAIGVVYQPEREYPGNYVPSIVSARYDAFIFIAETTALTPVQSANRHR